MNNSMEIAETAPQPPKDLAQNPKTVWITGLLTLVTTVAVSFIGVVPTLRRGDAEAIDILKQKITSIEKTQSPGNTSTSPDPKLTIHGTVMTKDGQRTPNGFEVFFLPEGNNLNTATTDASGKFYKEMPAGTYSIIVREASNGKSAKGMLAEDENEVNLVESLGVKVNYRMKRK